MHHLNIRYIFVKDDFENGMTDTEFLRTGGMIADFLTKPLQGEIFRKLMEEILGSTVPITCTSR